MGSHGGGGQGGPDQEDSPSPGLCLVNKEAGLVRPWALDVCSACFQGMPGVLSPFTEPKFTMGCALQP